MSEQEYDLKKSEKVMGELLPVIKDAHGRTIDGLHREKVKAQWRVEVWDSIKTEEDYWKARAHLNFSRRNAQEARAEKLQIINSLAEFYIKQGLQVSGEKPDNAGRGGGSASGYNEVVDAVAKALDGALTEGFIRKNIDKKYLQKQEAKKQPERRDIPVDVSPAERKIRQEYGRKYHDKADIDIEALRQEAREELKDEIRQEVIKEISEATAISITPELTEEEKQEQSETIKEYAETVAPGIREGLLQMNRDSELLGPIRKLNANIGYLKLIQQHLKTGELFNATDREAILNWSNGQTLQESIEAMEKMVGE